MIVKKKILFITGTRADFGKLKPLILNTQELPNFEVEVFVTGMHMLASHGNTHAEIPKSGVQKSVTFINQIEGEDPSLILANTLSGLRRYIAENRPDLIVTHGDRVEALAAAITGGLSNVRVAHIEGGERSGTIDESIRHAVTKFSHIHFVGNENAKERLLRMGEPEDSIHIIGSPNVDIMLNANLPVLEEVRRHYEIPFDEYGLVIFHPVTTDDSVAAQISVVVKALLESDLNYVLIEPNNDHGSSLIREELKKIRGQERFKILPSMRFEYYLTLLRNSLFILGNSSSGIYEAPVYGVPTINIGLRQNGRAKCLSIHDAPPSLNEIKELISRFQKKTRFEPELIYGKGNSTELFIDELKKGKIFERNLQKHFVDYL